MAWTTPLTAAANTPLTAAQWNASVRDNLLLTPAALATTAGQLWVSTGTIAGAMRSPQSQHISATCTATSIATYGAPATGTAGPIVVVTTGTQAITAIGALIQNSTGGAGGSVSYTISGATTLAATDAWSTQARPSGVANNFRHSSVHLQSGLTGGANTFTAVYTTPTGGTATFAERQLLVFPL